MKKGFEFALWKRALCSPCGKGLEFALWKRALCWPCGKGLGFALWKGALNSPSGKGLCVRLVEKGFVNACLGERTLLMCSSEYRAL